MMIHFFHSVEFYVLLLFVAAAILALCVRPSRRGEALTHLVAGWFATSENESGSDPQLHIRVLENGNVEIRRTGLSGIGEGASTALAVTQIGFDLEIKERTLEGYRPLVPADFDAVFILNFLAPEWYHIRYVDERTARMAAFSLHVRPGLKMTKPLVQ